MQQVAPSEACAPPSTGSPKPVRRGDDAKRPKLSAPCPTTGASLHAARLLEARRQFYNDYRLHEDALCRSPLFSWHGTLLPRIVRAPSFWLAILIYTAVGISQKLLPEKDGLAVPDMKVITYIGGFFGFLLVFYASQNYKRYSDQYWLSFNCVKAISRVAVLARTWSGRSSEMQNALNNIWRYANAAHLCAYVELSPEYDHEFFSAFNAECSLLNGPEVQALLKLGFESSSGRGHIFQIVITWAMMELKYLATEELLLRPWAKDLSVVLEDLRSTLSKLFGYRDHSVPFSYYHLLFVLRFSYLPCFSYSVGTSFGHSNFVLGLWVVLLTSTFVAGLCILGSRLSDPYGKDLEDLSVLTFVNQALENGRRILQTEDVNRRDMLAREKQPETLDSKEQPGAPHSPLGTSEMRQWMTAHGISWTLQMAQDELLEAVHSHGGRGPLPGEHCFNLARPTSLARRHRYIEKPCAAMLHGTECDALTHPHGNGTQEMHAELISGIGFREGPEVCGIGQEKIPVRNHLNLIPIAVQSSPAPGQGMS